MEDIFGLKGLYITYNCFDVETLSGLNLGDVFGWQSLQDGRLSWIVQTEDKDTTLPVVSLEATQKVKKSHIVWFFKYYTSRLNGRILIKLLKEEIGTIEKLMYGLHY